MSNNNNNVDPYIDRDKIQQCNQCNKIQAYCHSCQIYYCFLHDLCPCKLKKKQQQKEDLK